MPTDYSDILMLKKGYIAKLKELDEVIKEYYSQVQDVADKEYIYRKTKAEAYTKLLADDTKVTVIAALADGITAKDRVYFKIAEGLIKATKENIKRLHASISAYQTLVSLAKVEINIK